MFGASDDDIIQWANAQVAAECGNPGLASRLAIKSFSDPTLSSGVFLMHLLNSVRGIVDWSNVSNGLTESEKQNNAQYIIRCVCVCARCMTLWFLDVFCDICALVCSVARKMGAAVFCTFEDIVRVRSKMIMNLVASVMLVDKNRRASVSGAPIGGGAGGP
jgi:plastin-1